MTGGQTDEEENEEGRRMRTTERQTNKNKNKKNRLAAERKLQVTKAYSDIE